uniref:GPI transamidase subunit PIG-U n=1 Tax=Arion vulgaris TaxID=1028688 RepID=A0A0B7A477_9EUPU
MGCERFFVLIDLFTMVFLYKIAVKFKEHMLEEENVNKEAYSPKAVSILLTVKSLSWLPSVVLAVHVLNPFSIMATLALSTGAITNLIILLAFYYFLAGNKLLCTVFIALSTYQAVYPFVFLVPTGLHFYKLSHSQPSSRSYISRRAVSSYFGTFTLYLVSLCLLIGVSYLTEGSWEFLLSTYGFILNVPDLTPNTGVFWYFFTEMFDHFRTFFVCVFQLNAVVYTVPLAVRFTEKPFFLMYILLVLTSIFKSYPSYADAALYFSLLPLWKHVFSYLRNTLVVAAMLLPAWSLPLFCIIFGYLLAVQMLTFILPSL